MLASVDYVVQDDDAPAPALASSFGIYQAYPLEEAAFDVPLSPMDAEVPDLYTFLVLCAPFPGGADTHVLPWCPTLLEAIKSNLADLPLATQAALASTCHPMRAVLRRFIVRAQEAALCALHRRLGTPEAALAGSAELRWAHKLLGATDLRLLAIRLADERFTPRELRTLRLSRNDLSGAAGRALLSSVPMKQLAVLDLSSCQLGTAGAAVLAEHLSRARWHRTLRELYLGCVNGMETTAPCIAREPSSAAGFARVSLHRVHVHPRLHARRL